MSSLLTEHMMVLFAILAIGATIGHLSIKGLSFGAAGVLLAALVFGHFGFTIPREVMDLGLVLFVYAVGLRAGPRFFRMFRRQGIHYVLIALVTAAGGAGITALVAHFMHLPFDLAAGLYAGAMTCTPALAGAVDSIGRLGNGNSANASVGYGVSYPYSMLGLVVLIQLLPKLLRRDIKNEEQRWQAEQQTDAAKLEVKQFRVTNPNCDGIPLKDLHAHRMSVVNISRVRRGDNVAVATPDFILQRDDVVMAVGISEELEKLRLLLGEETQVAMDLNTEVITADIRITGKEVAGKSIEQLRVSERYGVIITRFRRQGMEITPTGSITLEIGDSIHVVGARAAVEQFLQVADPAHHRTEETNMVSYLLGLALGVIIGLITIPLPYGFRIKLGIAGGTFLVSLVLGHFGRIGSFRIYVPVAAQNLSREFGLMLFLAGAGTTAGAHLVSVIRQHGISLLLAGVTVTTVVVALGLLVTCWFLRMNLLAAMGAICAAMTNPPALGAASAQTRTEIPTLAYASVYPAALIFKIVLSQILVDLLGRF